MNSAPISSLINLGCLLLQNELWFLRGHQLLISVKGKIDLENLGICWYDLILKYFESTTLYDILYLFLLALEYLRVITMILLVWGYLFHEDAVDG